MKSPSIISYGALACLISLAGVAYGAEEGEPVPIDSSHDSDTNSSQASPTTTTADDAPGIEAPVHSTDDETALPGELEEDSSAEDDVSSPTMEEMTACHREAGKRPDCEIACQDGAGDGG